MMRRTLLAGIFLTVLLPLARAQAPAKETWFFEQLRTWANAANGPNDLWDGNNTQGVAGHPEVPRGSPLFKELSVQFSRRSGIVDEGNQPQAPDGKLVWWDVDNDGVQDLVFAGGASPDPYFVILKTVHGNWRVWQEGRGRLLAIVARDAQVVMIAGVDGYGVERERGLDITILDLREIQARSREVTFRWVGELPGLAVQGSADPCTIVRITSLRTSPQVDNTPEESGMGFDWPGNLFQELDQGSTGWVLDRTKNPKGEWSLVVFPRPATVPGEADAVKDMKTPVKATRPAAWGPAGQAFLVGWVKTSDLAR